MHTPPTPAPPAALRVSKEDSWTIHEFDSVSSTNLIARALPPWSAVRAATQTHGYGRTGRSWVSDAGGLWLSATIPTPGPREKWAILPLAAGWATIEALRSLDVTSLRLRWPNDIMVGRRKLAGLLLERFDAESTVIGIGLNIANHPDHLAPVLNGFTTRLRELTSASCTIPEVTRLLLQAFTRVHRILMRDGFGPIADLINLQWDTSRRVELSLGNGLMVRGRFDGIDKDGRLLTEVDGRLVVYGAEEVALLRELD